MQLLEVVYNEEFTHLLIFMVEIYDNLTMWNFKTREENGDNLKLLGIKFKCLKIQKYLRIIKLQEEKNKSFKSQIEHQLLNINSHPKRIEF